MATYAGREDPFAALGLSRSASKSAVTVRYRTVIRLHHPDKQHDSSPENLHAREELTKLLNWAKSECLREIEANERRRSMWETGQWHPRKATPTWTDETLISANSRRQRSDYEDFSWCRHYCPNNTRTDRPISTKSVPLYLVSMILVSLLFYAFPPNDYRVSHRSLEVPNMDESAYDLYFKCLTIHEENETISHRRVTVVSFEREVKEKRWKKFDEEIKENGQLVYHHRNLTISDRYTPSTVIFQEVREVVSTVFRLRGDPSWRMVKTVTKGSPHTRNENSVESPAKVTFFHRGKLITHLFEVE